MLDTCLVDAGMLSDGSQNHVSLFLYDYLIGLFIKYLSQGQFLKIFKWKQFICVEISKNRRPLNDLRTIAYYTILIPRLKRP